MPFHLRRDLHLPSVIVLAAALLPRLLLPLGLAILLDERGRPPTPSLQLRNPLQRSLQLLFKMTILLPQHFILLAQLFYLCLWFHALKYTTFLHNSELLPSS